MNPTYPGSAFSTGAPEPGMYYIGLYNDVKASEALQDYTLQVSLGPGPGASSSCKSCAPGFAGSASPARKRDSRIRLRALGIFFSTQTGNTETVAGMIAEAAGVEPTEIGEIDMADLAGYDGLIVGCPTWNTGADEMRSGTSWDDLLDDIKGVDLKGKTVAVFGCGDSGSYGDNFVDGIEELHDTFAAAGAKMVGYADSSGYSHTESKSERDGKFLGLPLDQDNEDDQTEDRVSNWISQLKGEGMAM